TAYAISTRPEYRTVVNRSKIKYFSTDKAGNSETVNTSAAAQVDKAAPSTTDDVPAGFVNHDVSVTLTASDTGGSGVDKTYFEKEIGRAAWREGAVVWEGDR